MIKRQIKGWLPIVQLIVSSRIAPLGGLKLLIPIRNWGSMERSAFSTDKLLREDFADWLEKGLQRRSPSDGRRCGFSQMPARETAIPIPLLASLATSFPSMADLLVRGVEEAVV